MEITEKQKILIALAIQWAEVNYLRDDLKPEEVTLLEAANNALEEPETMTLADLC